MRLDALLSACLLATAANASEYIVDPANAAASDTGSGTAAAPFRTIARAVQGLRAGDTVTIHRGTYREAVRFAASGTASQPITIRAFAGDEGAVVITGSDPVGGWTRDAGEQWSIPWDLSLPAEYPVADWPAPTALQLRTEMVFADGRWLRQVLARAELVRGTFCVDDAAHRMIAVLPDGTSPNLHAMEAAKRQSGFSSSGAWTRILGLTVMHVANTYQHGAFVIGGDDALAQGDRAEWNNLDGLHFSGTRLHAVGNVAAHNGECGISANLWSCVIEGNTTDDNSWRFGPGWADGGMKIVGGGPTGNLVRNHTSRNNDGPGIWFDWDCRDNRIEGCYLDNNLYAGVMIEASWPGNAVVDNVIRRTRSWHGYQYEDSTGAGLLLSSTQGTLVANNTLIDNERYGILFAGGVRGNGAYCKDNRFLDDIVAGNGVCGVFYWLWDAGADPANISSELFDYDLWHQPTNAIALGHGMDSATLAAWRSHGQDAHGSSAEPLLVDRAAGDARLSADSPAIDAGIAVAGVGIDRVGVARPQGAAPDIGAYERVATVTPPPPVSPPPTTAGATGGGSSGGADAGATGSTGCGLGAGIAALTAAAWLLGGRRAIGR